MSGWFSKPTNVFKPEVTDQPQPFVVLCGCGEEQRGLRKDRHQRIQCKACGVESFILPRDVYPATRILTAKEQSPTRSTLSQSEELQVDDLEEILQTEPAARRSEKGKPRRKQLDATSDEPRSLPTLSELRERVKKSAKPRQTRVADAVPEKPGQLAAIGKSLGDIGREAGKDFVRFWSPFRILVAAVLAFLLLTTAWMWRQSSLSQAAQIAKAEGELGLQAVEKEDWSVARPHLQLAAAALEKLGRNDPEAATIKQFARETHAQFRLCELSIDELINKARAELTARGEKNRNRKGLVPVYQSDWLILEGMVQETTPAGARRRQFGMKVPLAGQEVLVQCNFPVFKHLVPEGASKSVVLAGTLFDVEKTDDGIWKITLEPSSGFLWTHLATYKAVGFEFNSLRSEEIVQSELAAQARIMGVPE